MPWTWWYAIHFDISSRTSDRTTEGRRNASPVAHERLGISREFHNPILTVDKTQSDLYLFPAFKSSRSFDTVLIDCYIDTIILRL